MASTGTQTIGIYDVCLFTTKLAMYYRAILRCGVFQLFCERRMTFVAVFWSIFLVIKAKQDQISYCFWFNLLCERFFDRFHEKIEVIRQIRWE